MNLGKCIHELLLENETVIIPGFGAFVSIYKPSEINDENNEITPPTKLISFNQQIRNNDGLLVGYVAEIENISHFNALKKIETERENILYQLDKGEKVILENTGTLLHGEKQEIQFTPLVEDNLLLDSFGLESISLQEEEPETENEVAEENVPATTVADEKTETIQEQEQHNEKQEILAPVDSKEEKQTPVYSNPPVTETKEKKKRGGLWYLLMLIPLIIAGIFVIKNETDTDIPEKEIIENETLNQPAETNTEILPADSSVIDSTQMLAVIEEENKIDSTQIIPSDSTQFYLVGGSFKEEVNAEKFIQEYNIEGYEPFHLGKKGNFYIVAIGKYNSVAEASVAKREFMLKNPGSGIWVLEE